MLHARNPEDDLLAVERAENYLWEVIAQMLAARGEETRAEALQKLLCARPEQLRVENGFKRIRFNLYYPLSDYWAEYNARTGEQMTWRFSALREGLGRRLDEEACLEVAREVAQPPADAILDRYGYQEIGSQPVFLASWAHLYQGIPVDGDYIQVLVNGETGKAYALARKWHQIDTAPSER